MHENAMRKVYGVANCCSGICPENLPDRKRARMPNSKKRASMSSSPNRLYNLSIICKMHYCHVDEYAAIVCKCQSTNGDHMHETGRALRDEVPELSSISMDGVNHACSISAI